MYVFLTRFVITNHIAFTMSTRRLALTLKGIAQRGVRGRASARPHVSACLGTGQLSLLQDLEEEVHDA